MYPRRTQGALGQNKQLQPLGHSCFYCNRTSISQLRCTQGVPTLPSPLWPPSFRCAQWCKGPHPHPECGAAAEVHLWRTLTPPLLPWSPFPSFRRAQWCKGPSPHPERGVAAAKEGDDPVRVHVRRTRSPPGPWSVSVRRIWCGVRRGRSGRPRAVPPVPGSHGVPLSGALPPLYQGTPRVPLDPTPITHCGTGLPSFSAAKEFHLLVLFPPLYQGMQGVPLHPRPYTRTPRRHWPAVSL